MNSLDSANLSPLQAIKQEIRAQASILREIIVAIQTSSKAADFLTVAIKSTQTLLEKIKNSEFAFLTPLLQNLERYFYTVQEGMSINQKHIETLSAIVAELMYLADLKTHQIEKPEYQKRLKALSEVKNKLRQFIHEYEVKHPVLTQKTFETHEEDLSPIKTEKIYLKESDSAIASLFLNDLPKQVQRLKENVETLKKTPESSAEASRSIQAIQTITQAAKIVQIDSLVELGKGLEEFFKTMEAQKLNWKEEIDLAISQALQFLDELSHISVNQLVSFIHEHAAELLRLTQQIRQLAESNLSFSSLEEESFKKDMHPKTVSHELYQETTFDASMFDLFSIELETQCKVFNQGLIDLEQKPKDQKLLESLMRAAHSIKGAARVVSLSPIVQLAHAMEDCFVAAQNQKLDISVTQIDQLLRSVDLLSRLSKVKTKELNSWLKEQHPLIETLIQEIAIPSSRLVESESKNIRKFTKQETIGLPPLPLIKVVKKEETKKVETKKAFQTAFNQDRVLRITAQNLNRLMGLAGESLVESRWLYPFGDSLQEFKNNLKDVAGLTDLLRDSLKKEQLNEETQVYLKELHQKLNEMRYHLSGRLNELDSFIRRHSSLSDRLYQEVINSRMRPFADGVEGFPRMVRDLAHQLGKRVKLEIEGKSTPVDRDILEKLESPLSHLLRNAIDHGIESPEERIAVGKSAEGVIKLEARHRGGMLAITVSDDGRGIDIEQLRQKILEKNLASQDMANRLTDAEILDFLFLPGFSTSASVTEISGRGVGLNVVQNTIQEVGGSVHIVFTPGKGMTFHLQLPLTLSVIRALLVEISGEAYAFPLARIDQAFLVNREEVEIIENRQFFHYEGQNIGLISAWQVLELDEPQFTVQRLPVIVVSDRTNSYGIVVDRLMGEKELVVQELDPRLGKIPDISAGALMEDGSPILIIDIEDIVLSIDNLLSGGRLTKIAYSSESQTSRPRKRVLVVDDSITVREVECRLLQNQGYEVETAVNGIDGWNAARIGHYDLIITDIDMPRMNGIELLRAIRSDPKLQHLPVMIVSYKEDEGDRIQGLEAGANYYLTKSSFHDATLIEAVKDLIGKP